MSELVHMKGIRKSYDGKRFVLDGVDLSVTEGEIATIVGASGSGKSTLLNIIGLLDNYTEGEYELNGTVIQRKKLNTYNRQRATDLGFIFQAYCLIESITVKENILMPYMYNGLKIDREVYESMDRLLGELNIDKLREKKVSLLSGGEKQRVAICRAMLKKPKLIIADEPTGNLDETNALLVTEAFRRIASAGTAIMVVTHNRHLSFGEGKVYRLDGGVLTAC